MIYDNRGIKMFCLLCSGPLILANECLEAAFSPHFVLSLCSGPLILANECLEAGLQSTFPHITSFFYIFWSSIHIFPYYVSFFIFWSSVHISPYYVSFLYYFLVFSPNFPILRQFFILFFDLQSTCPHITSVFFVIF